MPLTPNQAQLIKFVLDGEAKYPELVQAAQQLVEETVNDWTENLDPTAPFEYIYTAQIALGEALVDAYQQLASNCILAWAEHIKRN